LQTVKRTYNLFLDDIRDPIHAYHYTGYIPFTDNEWKIVRDYNQFVDFIERNWKLLHAFPKLIAFDHDLADEHYTPKAYGNSYNSSKEYQESQNYKEKTGMDCAKWLVDFCMDNELELPEYVCHSMNPVGKDNIISLLDNFKKNQDVYNN
jgi:hypothetical protein